MGPTQRTPKLLFMCRIIAQRHFALDKINNPNKMKAEYSVVLDQSKKKKKIVPLRHLKNPFWETLHLLLSYYY